ncbi:hypothetical protein Rs2_29100 [Raphanus sativus]|nr:hypothetical protein Rs2_29100 [Raphanus sativus]
MSDSSVNNGYIIDIDSDFDDYSEADPTNYFANLDLRYFAAKPKEMLDENTELKEKCLENDNPVAHYIEGILKYFIANEQRAGLYHFRQASIGKNDEGTLLYGLLMMVRGHYWKGRKYMDKLRWLEKPSRSNQSWERIKNSLSSIPCSFTHDDYAEMVNIRPRRMCHPEDDRTLVCDECYYYKRVYQWFTFVTREE